jgi:heavy metal translocating P-type ATPase
VRGLQLREDKLNFALLILAMACLFLGLAAFSYGRQSEAGIIWGFATACVVAGLAVAIFKDFLIGRIGVDAIALVSMSAALLLNQPLAGVVVAIMYSGGNVLEDFARGRAERNLKALSDRTPRWARRRNGGEYAEISASEIRPDDELLVMAGELLPADGLMLDAFAVIDESTVTGEPLPETRAFGEKLQSGTLNAGEAFHMRATASADQSTYAGIVRMVAAAQTAKAPFLRMADRFALWLLPLTLIVSGGAWFASGDPVRGLAVLVAATPCPLILAAPVAMIGGVSRAANLGVLMKGGAALEALAQTRTAMFDKTGTLTEGGTKLLAVKTVPALDRAEALRILASLEQASHHVLAGSIVETARKENLRLSTPLETHEHRGSGIEGRIDGRKIRAGSQSLVMGEARLPPRFASFVNEYGGESVLTVYMTIGGTLSAVFIFGDGIRDDSRRAIASLRSEGIGRFVLVTGDDARTAQAVGAQLGMDSVLANCKPAEKVEAVVKEQQAAPTMMVGDGINDAPALAAAHVGIAMGARGATASSEAADIVVLADRLDLVPQALAIARRTQSIALQSVWAGLGLSGFAMAAAAFGFLPPVAGAITQEAIDVAVIVNALRASRD